MKKEQLKKISLLFMSGFICTTVGTAQTSSANPITSNIQVGQKFVAPGLPEKTVVIAHQKADVTGDKVEDEVVFVGIPEKDENHFYHHLALAVKEGSAQAYQILPLTFRGHDGTQHPKSGNNPQLLEIVDRNGDGVHDIFLQLGDDLINSNDFVEWDKKEKKFTILNQDAQSIIPPSWIDHYTVKHTDSLRMIDPNQANTNQIQPLVVTEFFMAEKRKAIPKARLLVTSIYKKKDWELLNSKNAASSGKVVLEANDYTLLDTLISKQEKDSHEKRSSGKRVRITADIVVVAHKPITELDPQSENGKRFEKLQRDFNVQELAKFFENQMRHPRFTDQEKFFKDVIKVPLSKLEAEASDKGTIVDKLDKLYKENKI